MQSGQVCNASGYYRCNIHKENYLRIEKGDLCPECPHGPYGWHKTLWTPARRVSHIVAELKNSTVAT